MAAGGANRTSILGELKLRIGRGGSGRPVLVLHHDIGTLDKLPFYEALSARFDVIVPNHPGFGDKSERPQWLRHPRDIASLYQWLLAELGVERASLVGLGFGGWIAAEMAALAPRDFHRLVLVGAMGVKPPEGDIFDQAIVSYIDYARPASTTRRRSRGVYGDVSTDQLVDWDLCREMSFRIAWKPYMYSQTLPHLLGGVRRRRWSSGATTTRSCRAAPASSTPSSLRQGAARDRRRLRALRRHGTAGRARPARHRLRRRELSWTAGALPACGQDGRAPTRRPPCM